MTWKRSGRCLLRGATGTGGSTDRLMPRSGPSRRKNGCVARRSWSDLYFARNTLQPEILGTVDFFVSGLSVGLKCVCVLQWFF